MIKGHAICLPTMTTSFKTNAGTYQLHSHISQLQVINLVLYSEVNLFMKKTRKYAY